MTVWEELALLPILKTAQRTYWLPLWCCCTSLRSGFRNSKLWYLMISLGFRIGAPLSFQVVRKLQLLDG